MFRSATWRKAITSNRKLFIILFSLILIVSFSWFGLKHKSKSTVELQNVKTSSLSKKGRSVILITLDTTRPDRLEPYGATQVATPNLQNLANRGVVFENAWAVAPITLVSHASILSGLYPFEHGVRNNGTQYVEGSVTTLAERLFEEGYRTSAFVSAAVLDRRYGLNQGFEVYDDDLSDRRNLSPRMVADRTADSTVKATKKWLDELSGEEPFFTWVHFYDPHANYSPPPPFRDDYRDRLYDGEIAYMDQQIGELLAHPKLLGAGSDGPVVMVIADHGESLGEHGEKTHALLAYDSTLHVPFIIHVPEGPAGLRVKESVGHVDVMPTVLSLLDMSNDDFSAKMSGRDISGLMTGRSSEPNRSYYSETFLPYYTYGWEKLRVLRKGRWKIIDAPQSELYDLSRDPRELSDVYSIQSDKSHDLKRDLDEWLSKHNDDSEANLSLDGEELAKLRSLGYLSVGSGRVVDRENRPNPMVMIDQHVGLERARMLLSDGFYKQAVIQLQNVLRRDPQNLAALIDLVRAHEGLGEIYEAIENAKHALELDPEYVQTYITLARLEAQRDDLNQALELVNMGINLDPKNPESRIVKASFLNRQGKNEEAAQVLKEALVDNPDHPRLNTVFAHIVEARSGDYKAAEIRLRSALKRDPFQVEAWRFLGLLLERKQRYDEAEESYKSGLKKRPDDAELHGSLGHLLAKQGRLVDAEVQLREAIRLSSTPRSELYVSLGGILAEQGMVEEARLEYDKVIAINPNHPGARNNAAIALYKSGRIEEAKEALKTVIYQFPRHADAHNNLAAIAVDEREWQTAVKYSLDTISLAPEIVEAWNNLAIAQEGLNEFEKAKKSYLKTLELDSEYWPAYFNLGLLLIKMNETSEAINQFDKVLTRVPSHPDTHLELGFIYAENSKNLKLAKTHFNAFLRHSGQHPRREEILKRLNQL